MNIPDPAQFVQLFGCDTARITCPCKTLFLIIGHNRRSTGQWTRNGEPFEFDYIQEKVAASGKTEKDLMVSAKRYKKLAAMQPKDKAIALSSLLQAEKGGDA